MASIKVYNPQAFTSRHMPSPELAALLRGDRTRFLVVRVEEMYKHVQGPVPASRSTTHTCLYLTSGEALMTIGSGRYTAHKGEILFVPAGQVFSFGPGDVNKGYLCTFHEDMLRGQGRFEILKVWGNPHVRLEKEAAGAVLQCFRRMLTLYRETGLKDPDILQAYLLTLLHEVDRAYKPLSDSKHTAAVHTTNRFKELVFKNIHQLHRVSDYASLLNISPNHLNKTVKAITDRSPTRWIDEAILLEAKVLLLQTALTVGEVAAAVGLEDASYFSRLFRKYEKVTPSAFRRMIEKSSSSTHPS